MVWRIGDLPIGLDAVDFGKSQLPDLESISVGFIWRNPSSLSIPDLFPLYNQCGTAFDDVVFFECLFQLLILNSFILNFLIPPSH
jgi:hypothetical protein